MKGAAQGQLAPEVSTKTTTPQKIPLQQPQLSPSPSLLYPKTQVILSSRYQFFNLRMIFSTFLQSSVNLVPLIYNLSDENNQLTKLEKKNKLFLFFIFAGMLIFDLLTKVVSSSTTLRIEVVTRITTTLTLFIVVSAIHCRVNNNSFDNLAFGSCIPLLIPNPTSVKSQSHNLY